MCGIFGLLKINSNLEEKDINLTNRASKMMIHRGPDDEGLWYDENVSLAFRRLSIIDLSSGGHQPMQSFDGRYVLIYNGELYNYLDLKRELSAKGYVFNSKSDSEVVLNALIEWGNLALPRFNGMFALCFYDTQEKSIIVSRDHVGMKPLYIGYSDNYIVVSSQLNQAMLAFEPNELTIDQRGLELFLSLGYYPSPRTVFNEIKQVEPGSWLKLSKDGRKQEGKHFDLLEFYYQNSSDILPSTELADHLKFAVTRHLMSDVPVATFLSGGLDSAIITGLTRELIGKNFTAYTLSNPGTKHDEAERASKIAKTLGIAHKIVYPIGIEQVVSDFQEAYQEPFGDYSALPSLIVTRHARTEVKVMLSGDGSDEFFYGYNRMQSMLSGAKFYCLPLSIRKVIKRIMPSIPAITFGDLNTMVFKKQSWIPEIAILNSETTNEYLLDDFFGSLEKKNLPVDVLIKLNTINRYFQLQLLKLDRASMFNSIEARVPFADKEFMRYSIAYRAKHATQNGYTKRKLPIIEIFQAMYPGIPLEAGPKRGFTIDMQKIMRTDLKPMIMDMLNTRSAFDGSINFSLSRELFESRSEISPFFFWSLLSLQLWSSRYYAK